MSTYAPGTLFRINIEGSRYTSVLLKDGKVLEVKNPINSKKTVYDSVQAWCAHHNVKEEDVQPDESRNNTFRAPAYFIDGNGFYVPLKKSNPFRWVNWCYQIVNEGVPSLFQVEEFKTAYNAMVELAVKHKKELHHSKYYFSSLYSAHLLDYQPKSYSKWYGYLGCFIWEGSNRDKRYTKAEYEEARNDILRVYKQIIDIIKPKVSKYIETKRKLLSVEANLKYEEKILARYTKKIHDLQDSADAAIHQIDKLKEKREKYLAELASH